MNPTTSVAAAPEETAPPLMQDTSFWSMATTQFLGAFNDNVFKQLVALLATPAPHELAAGIPDRQAEAQIVFAAAFLLFSGFAGWLSERYSKRSVVVSCKIAEILIVSLGLIGFWMYGSWGLEGLLVVLFLMGLHSAFFGPAKYGILPEMIRERDLPRANGIFLMLTFLAIIFGTVLAGQFASKAEHLWRGSIACIVIAVFGTLTALTIRPVRAANPQARLRFSDWLVPPEMIRLVRQDRQLLLALLVTSLFWLLGGVVTQAVNGLGKTQLGKSNEQTSMLTAMLGVGIPFGCLLGGYLSRGKISPRVVLAGATGIFISLILMSLRGGEQQHLLGYRGSFPVLILLGVSAGIFVVPIQVSLQALPPAGEKGKMIALMNQCNWIGVILGAAIYWGSFKFSQNFEQPINTTFALMALVMVPIVLFYRPQERTLSA